MMGYVARGRHGEDKKIENDVYNYFIIVCFDNKFIFPVTSVPPYTSLFILQIYSLIHHTEMVHQRRETTAITFLENCSDLAINYRSLDWRD
jgi:hypothetical protein